MATEVGYRYSDFRGCAAFSSENQVKRTKPCVFLPPGMIAKFVFYVNGKGLFLGFFSSWEPL
jgi:hypothetical protein